MVNASQTLFSPKEKLILLLGIGRVQARTNQ